MNTDKAPLPVDILARLAFVTSARLERRGAEVELSIQQVRLLGILRDRQPTINELAAHLGTDKSSMSGAVLRAERRGLVSRVPDEDDGRVVRVRLEPEGRALVDAASARFDDDVQQMFAAVTVAERAQWVALSIRLLESEAEGRDGLG